MKRKYKKQPAILFVSAIIVVIFIIFVSSTNPINPELPKQNTNFRTPSYTTGMPIDSIVKSSTNGYIGYTETIEEIMARDKYFQVNKSEDRENFEHEVDRKNLPQNPESKYESQYPPLSKDYEPPVLNPQTLGTTFTGSVYSDAGAYPPDVMGAAGPTQYIVAVNGRIRTFNKTSGTTDGALNTSMDNFFASVMTPPISSNFTSDPRIRYDRLTGRWFVIIIDVPGGAGTQPNRVLIGVSSGSTITSQSSFTFFYFRHDQLNPAGDANTFCDYPTLGIDRYALYIGGNLFSTTTGSFSWTSGYVINKANLISGSLTGTAFRNLTGGSGGAGPYTPQGVDNFDPNATEGYFIGVDNVSYGLLQLRRISNPGGTPTISGNISLTVSSTYAPLTVPNQGGTRSLDALDDRLFAAHYRNGSLWTAHNVRVNTSGVSSSAGTRNGSRWYELRGIPTGQTPSVYQSGTIYNNASSNPLYYWIPSIMVSGQGHVAAGFSIAGATSYAKCGTCGRLSTDALGTMQAVTTYMNSSTAYNLGSTNPRRWGDYSYTCVDPNDDMTMWTIQEFCNATNSYGVRVVKLIAPPPPAAGNLTALPSQIDSGLAAVTVVITSSSPGFYDPGAGFPNRISASCSNGVTVNSITYNNASQVTLSLNTQGFHSALPNSFIPITLTITNPDGQSISAPGLISVQNSPLPVELISFTSEIIKNDVRLQWQTSKEINNKGFYIERKKISDADWKNISFLNGKGNTNNITTYSYEDKYLNTGTYSYRLKQTDYNGNFEYFNLSINVQIGIPAKYELSQNYPNPFNPLTRVKYQIAKAGNVKLVIYDISGKEVKTLVNTNQEAGYYEISFDGYSLSSGVYFYRITANNFVETKKMLLLK
jgi:hypothetical protein